MIILYHTKYVCQVKFDKFFHFFIIFLKIYSLAVFNHDNCCIIPYICKWQIFRLGTIRLGTIRCRTIRLGTIRCRTIRLGTIRLGTIRLGTIRLGTIRLGTIRLGTIRLGTKSDRNHTCTPTLTHTRAYMHRLVNLYMHRLVIRVMHRLVNLYMHRLMNQKSPQEINPVGFDV